MLSRGPILVLSVIRCTRSTPDPHVDRLILFDLGGQKLRADQQVLAQKSWVPALGPTPVPFSHGGHSATVPPVFWAWRSVWMRYARNQLGKSRSKTFVNWSGPTSPKAIRLNSSAAFPSAKESRIHGPPIAPLAITRSVKYSRNEIFQSDPRSMLEFPP